MNKAEVSKAVSKLRYNLSDRRRRLKNIEGPKGRHDKIRKVVTALFKHERIELNYNLADESRGYAERLISDAIRYGPNHKEMMDMASYWLTEKQLVHKLFKVLVPRYEKFPLSYTKMWKAPKVGFSNYFQPCVLELKNNVYPPLAPDKTYNKNLIHNVLLKEAKKFYEMQKELQLKEKHSQMNQVLDEVSKTENQSSSSSSSSIISEANVSKLDEDVSCVQKSINELQLNEEENKNSLKSAESTELNSDNLEFKIENEEKKSDSDIQLKSNESSSSPAKENS